MVKKDGLLRYLFVTLFTVGSLLLSLTPYTALRSGGRHSIVSAYIKGASTVPFRQAIVKKYIVQPSHIKTRYKGGECGYDAALFTTVVSNMGFVSGSVTLDNEAFIFYSAHFSFKLRGPPVCNVLA